MKAAVLNAIKEPLAVKDVPLREPEKEEVVLRQTLTGICYRDILTRDGFLPRVKLPIIPGHEISGVIESIGESVQGFKIGQRVASLIYAPCGKCEFCLRGEENLCPHKEAYGESRNGAYGERVIVSSRSLVPVPDGIPDADATLAACVTGMLYNAIGRVGGLKEGQRILISGAGGGVGVHAIQIAKALGGYVIAKTSSPWKREALLKIGADEVITSDNFDREIKSKFNDGVHLALEAVGLPTFERTLRSLRSGGRMVVVGNVNPESVQLPLGLIIMKGNSISGSISSTRKDVETALDLTSKGKIHAVSDRTVSLDEVNNAFSDMQNRRSLGRILIDVTK